MRRPVILRPRAEHDIQSIFEWYESQRLGLREEFLVSLLARLESIRNFPESFPALYRNVRRALVSRFPYLIFYIAQPKRIVVLAILHASRNPASWPRR